MENQSPHSLAAATSDVSQSQPQPPHESFRFIPKFYRPTPSRQPLRDDTASRLDRDNSDSSSSSASAASPPFPPSSPSKMSRSTSRTALDVPSSSSSSDPSSSSSAPPVLIRSTSLTTTTPAVPPEGGASSTRSSSPPALEFQPPPPHAHAPSLSQLVRQLSKSKFLKAKREGAMDDADLQAVNLRLVEASGTTDEMLDYEKFDKIRNALPEKARRFFRPEAYASEPVVDELGRISVRSFFVRLLKSQSLFRIRCDLHRFDSDGRGVLREQDLEKYIEHLIPLLPPLRVMESNFHRFYVFTACRKFMFFLTPNTRAGGGVAIRQIVKSDVLKELLALTTLVGDSDNTAQQLLQQQQQQQQGGATENSQSPQSQALAPLPVVGGGGGGGRAAGGEYGGGGGNMDGQLMANWFSAENAMRVYEQYLELDKDQNGMLSNRELLSYCNPRVQLTPTFVDRLFEEITTYKERSDGGSADAAAQDASSSRTGEMDYKTFLDFVLAMENKKTPQSMHYFWRAIDMEKKGYIDSFDINYFFRDISVFFRNHGIDPANHLDVKDEIFDMVAPSDPSRITLDDLIKCGCGDTVIEILIDATGFLTYDNRENPNPPIVYGGEGAETAEDDLEE